MFSLNTVLQSLHPSKLAQTVSSNYSKLKQRISPPLPITEILPGLYHIDFPQKQHASQLLEHAQGKNILLINIGEYPYEDELPKVLLERCPTATILHLNFQLYGTLPFFQLIEAIAKVKETLSKGESVYLHCQEGRIRSAVFLSSYLYVSCGKDISEAILHVNKLLRIDVEGNSIAYKNQHTLFKNLVNYTTDRNFINKKQLELTRINISHAPRIRQKQHQKITKLQEVQLVLQVRCGQKVVHRCVYKDSVSQGESVCIDLAKLGKKVAISDEFLLVIKYLHKQTLYNVMRIQSNTNFIFNCFHRVHQHDIDLSAHCHPQKQPTFIDLTFTEGKESSRLAQLNTPPTQNSSNKNTSSSNNKDKSWDLLGHQIPDSNLYAPQQQFQWLHEQADIDEHELNSKIEQVMQNMSRKEEERGEDRQSEQQEDNFDDYLDKLVSEN